MVTAVLSAPRVYFSARDEMRCCGRHHLRAPGCFRLRMPTRLAASSPATATRREERIRKRTGRLLMQDIQLQTIAKAVVQRQERYQRNTLLFDQLVRLLVRGQPVAPELLARLLQLTMEQMRSILPTRGERLPHACAGWKAALPLGSTSISVFARQQEKVFRTFDNRIVSAGSAGKRSCG